MTEPSAPQGGIEMTDDELQRIVERTCTDKARYDNPGAARRAAAAARARRGIRISAYRCPFAGGTRATAHWHIGRVPSVASIERIAVAIRHRAQGAA